MGYRRVSSSDRVSAWQGPGTEIILYAATPEQRNNAHRTYDPGIHHLAFQLDNRASVAEVLKRALESGGRLLEDARLYPHYEPTYYAAFFEDPDGVKLEVMTLSSS